MKMNDSERYIWKDQNEDLSEEEKKEIQKVIKLKCYTDSDWKENDLILNRELKVKCARKHNQQQLQQASKPPMYTSVTCSLILILLVIITKPQSNTSAY